MRASNSPAVSWSTSTSRREKTGPVSRPSSSWNTEEAVRVSPARIAHWTGAAPRHLGRSEKCRLIHPSRGVVSTSGGMIAP